MQPLAHAQGRVDEPVSAFRRDIEVLPDGGSLASAFDQFLEQRTHIALVVDEYGGMEGILTLEDVLETLLGSEIVDEFDATRDMQAFARSLWRRRAAAMGLKVDDE